MSEVIHLFQRGYRGCDGKLFHGPFEIDTDLNFVTCKQCKKELNPMAVLDMIYKQQGRVSWREKELKELSQKVESKNKCKCQHCGKMTKIQKP